MKLKWGTMIIAVLLAASHVHADDSAASNEITAQDLLKLLVDEGVIDKEKAKALTEKIKSRQKTENQKADSQKTASQKTSSAGPVETVSEENKDRKPVADGNVVRVPYVPQYIRDEIRDQVRIGLKEDVSRDVLAQAKTERWGLPGVVPEWVEHIKFSGDMRMREESTLYAKGNVQGDYLDMAYINSKGTLSPSDPKVFQNTTEDRHRLRSRFRLGVKAKVNDRVEAGARLVTGNITDPVSTNQTLGNYGQKWQNNFDLAYLKYTSAEKQISLSGGRIENPFYSSDLVWDTDLTFEGVAASWWPLRSDDLDNEFRSFDPFITVGAFPIQEVDRSSTDKWLYAAQTGFKYDFDSQSKLTVALAYYAYENIVGKVNALDDTQLDYTAPLSMQKGNTLFNIRNNLDPASTSYLFANAVDYKLADFYVEYDIANFAPIHVIAVGDYVKNLGFDKKAVTDRLGFEIDSRTTGYQARVSVGWPQVTKARDWQVSFIYRYVERDAVLDAFTDSDFHGGGTDAKGYILKFDYGLMDNVWTTLRWLSSDEIDGNSYPQTTGLGSGKLGIDTLQLDLNAKF